MNSNNLTSIVPESEPQTNSDIALVGKMIGHLWYSRFLKRCFTSALNKQNPKIRSEVEALHRIGRQR